MVQEQSIIYSPAKINLGLKILDKRKDNYHNIYTLFLKIKLFDEIIINFDNHLSLPKFESNINLAFDESNTLYKAYRLLKNDFDIPSNFYLYLNKKIPHGGGLGGGSSNAAYLINFFDRYFGLNLSMSQKVEYGKKIGMDVPYFFYKTPAIGIERGDILFPVDIIGIENYKILLIFPKYNISTSDVYKSYNFSLTKSDFFIKIENLLKEEKRIVDFSCLAKIVENDLEKVVFKMYSELLDIKNFLYENKAVLSAMSGSGSTMFGFFENVEDIDRVLNNFPFKNCNFCVVEPFMEANN